MSNQDIGYVISNTPYREFDAMVFFFGEKYGLLRYVLRGYHRPKAKQTSLGLEFTKVKIQFDYRENSLQRIQNGELLESYQSFRTDYDWLIWMSLYTELLTRFYDMSHHDFWLKETSSLFEFLSPAKILAFLARLIQILGITPIVERCAVSGSTLVSDFSIEKGGFVSKQYRKGNSIVTLDMLKLIRYLFVSESLDINIIAQFDNLNELTNLLIQYLEYYEGIRLNSWKLIY